MTEAASVPPEPMTADAFVAWLKRRGGAQRFELVHGRPVTMAQDSLRHNLAKGRVYRALVTAGERSGLPCCVFVDGACVRISEDGVRISNVVVDCGDGDLGESFVALPAIVVDVVSPSSENRDTVLKLADSFATPGVHHYVLAPHDQRRLVWHRRAAGDHIDTRILGEGDLVLDSPGLTLSVSDLFGRPDSPGHAG